MEQKYIIYRKRDLESPSFAEPNERMVPHVEGKLCDCENVVSLFRETCPSCGKSVAKKEDTIIV